MKKIALMLIAFLITPSFVQAQSVSFTDLYEEHMNETAIQYLKSNKIVQGYDDGTFKPENRINRAEFTKIIIEAKYDDKDIDKCISNNIGTNLSYVFFPDVKKDEWYAKYVCMAKVNDIIDGYPDGTFKPGNNINFAEASKIIAESLDIKSDTAGTNNEWFAGYVKGLENEKAIPSSVQFFDKDITRGEMSEMIWRIKEEVTDKVSSSYTELTSPFPNITSCSALKEKFQEYNSYNRPMYMMKGMGGAFFDAPMATMAVAESADSSAESISADDYSSTNIQVAGVDEADIVKNDGEYVYMIKDDTVRIIKAFPPSVMSEVASITFGDNNFRPQEMFVADDKLTVIGQSNNYYSYYDYDIRPGIMPPYSSSQTKVYIYDIEDKGNPEQLRVVRFDGQYTTSRRINDDMYLIMNADPVYLRTNDKYEGEDYIPNIIDGDNDPEPMVGCADIRYFPGYSAPRYLIVASIPLDDKNGKIDKEVFLGSSENVYSSRTHLYVASSRVNYDRYSDWDWGRDSTKTNVYRFSLENGNVEFKARGEVPGTILNQFSMDAYKDNFRIATTIGHVSRVNNGEDLSTNNVYVLNQEMETVGKLEDLAPGEKIYSTRFMGDRLYMVTFKKVDPLFVIDLKTPTKPKILGKLKIPGYSDYLHPYDENHIIGIGKDAIDAKEGDFAWYQGMKVALFDVSDVENPRQKFNMIIGDRGTDSELLRNHKALLFDKEKELLAFPIRIQKKTGTRDCTYGDCTSPMYDTYETEFSGAIVLNINLTDGISERGRITNYTEEDILKMGEDWPYNWNNQIQRIIYIGNYLYTISQSMLKSSTMDDAKEVSYITID
ncbi:beta-propeller domain-containing protein [Candidatus Peregrinibacteria bacterium]|nr:beta-propeller domain-containing protein [Candidatus Peregrinibacteria bacterium]